MHTNFGYGVLLSLQFTFQNMHYNKYMNCTCCIIEDFPMEQGPFLTVITKFETTE